MTTPRRRAPRRAHALLPVLAALLVGWLLWRGAESRTGAPPAGPPYHHPPADALGTVARIVIVPHDGLQSAPRDIAADALKAVGQVEARMSAYDDESDIGRLNRARAGEWVAVDPRTWTVLLEAQRFHRLSGGAFDITVRPLRNLYPLGEDTPKELPTESAVRHALRRVGSEKLEFEREGMRVRFTVEGMAADLGAIAKGYAVDRAAAALQAAGVRDGMVEIGGEVRLLGRVPRLPNATQEVGAAGATTSTEPNRPWRTGIRHPRDPAALLATLERTDCAIATSGDYERFFEIDGERYSHILDPRTGRPLRGGVVSASVISPRTCLEADALATAVSVLGFENGKKLLALFPGVEAILILEAADGSLQKRRYTAPPEALPPAPGGEKNRTAAPPKAAP